MKSNRKNFGALCKGIATWGLIVALLVSMAVPAFAADKPKTIDERVAAIKETYGITVEYHSTNDKQATELQLTQLESALSYIGSVFAKKIVREYESTFKDFPSKGKFVITLACSNDGSTAQGVTGFSGISIGSTRSTIFPASKIVHEFGHALFNCTNTKTENIGGHPITNQVVPEPFASEKYTGKQISDSKRFISVYASYNAKEDYAECFSVAVLGGDKTPYSGSKDSAVYKKLKAVYDDLYEFAGRKARTTQRMAGYLGIELPVE